MHEVNDVVLEAIEGRRSVRAFLPAEIPIETIERILTAAARAPSGSNIQPWQVIVLTGEALQTFGATLEAHELAGGAGDPEYHYYPRAWREPYLARRRDVGWALYASLGIERGQKQAMASQNARNLRFFGAPVGLIFTLDRDMEIGSWLDLGMFLQNIMIAARAFGLDTCPQAAFSRYPGLIAGLLSIPAERQVICGMALGVADTTAPENRFPVPREPVRSFTRFVTTLDQPSQTVSAASQTAISSSARTT